MSLNFPETFFLDFLFLGFIFFRTFFLRSYFLRLYWQPHTYLGKKVPGIQNTGLYFQWHFFQGLEKIRTFSQKLFFPGLSYIDSKFGVGPNITPGKVYGRSNVKKLAHKIQFSINLKSPRNIHFSNSRILFLFCFKICIQRENVQNYNRKWAQSVLKA